MCVCVCVYIQTVCEGAWIKALPPLRPPADGGSEVWCTRATMRSREVPAATCARIIKSLAIKRPPAALIPSLRRAGYGGGPGQIFIYIHIGLPRAPAPSRGHREP